MKSIDSQASQNRIKKQNKSILKDSGVANNAIKPREGSVRFSQRNKEDLNEKNCVSIVNLDLDQTVGK